MVIKQVFDEDGFWTPELTFYPGGASPYAENIGIIFAPGVEVDSWDGPANWKKTRVGGKWRIGGPGKFTAGVQLQDANTMPGPKWDVPRDADGKPLPPILSVTLSTRTPIPYQTGLCKSYWQTPEGMDKIVNDYIGLSTGNSGTTPSPWSSL